MSKIKKIQLQPDNVTYDIDLPDNNPIKLNTVYSVMTADSVAGNTTAATYKSVRWYVSGVEGITAPYDGMKIVLKIPRAGAATVGVVLSLNGNTNADYHPVAYNVNGVLTTPFSANSIKLLTYDASATMDCYITSGTKSTVTGVWKTEADYDSNTTTTYGTLEYYFRPYAGERLSRYKLVALDKDNRIVPITTELYTGDYSTSTTYAIGDIVKSDSSYYRSKVNSNKNKAVTNTSYWEAYTMPTRFTPNTTAFKPEKIWFYNTTTTVAVGGALGGQTLTAIGYNTSILSNTFWESIPAYRVIYLAGTYNKTTGLFTLDSSTYYVLVPDNTANLALNSYFTSGKDYILVGSTYSSANYFQLFMNNPMFHFDGTNLVAWNTWNAEQSGGTGTVTSVRVQAGTGLTSSTSTAQTTSLDTTINIASGYKLPTTTEWDNVVTLNDTQNLTNKTLTNPIITGSDTSPSVITDPAGWLLVTGGGSGWSNGGTYIQHNNTTGTTNLVRLPTSNGTLALTSDIPADTNYYPVRSYTSGLQISSYSGSSNCQLYVPYATDSQYGVAKVAAVRSSAITTTTGGTTSDRYYGVEKDSNGKLFVNVPWEAGGGGTTVVSVGVEQALGGSGNITLDSSLGTLSAAYSPAGMRIKFNNPPTSNSDYDHIVNAGNGYCIDTAGTLSVAFVNISKMYMWPTGNQYFPQIETSYDGTVEINNNYSYSNPYELGIEEDGNVAVHVYGATGGGGAD